MGNQFMHAVSRGDLLDLPYYVHQDLVGCTYREQLGNGQVLKTIHCLLDERDVIVKVFIQKYTEHISIENQIIKWQVLSERFKIHVQPSILPMMLHEQKQENDDRSYLIRQYFASNLVDRAYSHPLLLPIEKLWLTFQVLSAITQCHGIGVRHGDIKGENIMVTSWNWLFLTEFAPYKPVKVTTDSFKFYFDTAKRNRCCIAPERFKKKAGMVGNSVTEAMDIFSAGCVIAEIFLDGAGLFDLEQLLLYGEDKYDPLPIIAKIKNPHIRILIAHMIQKDPAKRLSARSYIELWSGPNRCFPRYFVFLFKFFAQMLLPEFADPDIKLEAINKHATFIISKLTSKDNTREKKFAPQVESKQILQTDEDQKNSKAQKKPIHLNEGKDIDIEFLVSELKLFSQNLTNKSNYSFDHNLNPKRSIRRPVTSKQQQIPHVIEDEIQKENGCLILANLVCSCIQNVRHSISKLTALRLLLQLGQRVTDEACLKLIIPYIVSILGDSSATVRGTGVIILTELLTSLRNIPDRDLKLFPEYIWQALRLFSSDPEELVKLSYAKSLASLLETEFAFFNIDIARNFKKRCYDTEKSKIKYNAYLLVEESFRLGKSAVQRLLLEHMPRLCACFGDDNLAHLLPQLTSVLQDPDWELRATFFDRFVIPMAQFIPRRSFQGGNLQANLEMGLCDPEDFVVQKAVGAFTALCANGVFEQHSLLELAPKLQPLLAHPSTWIRNQTIDFFHVTSQMLGPGEAQQHLIPALKAFLDLDMIAVNRGTLVQSLKPPLTRTEYNNAIKPVLNVRPMSSSEAKEAMIDPDSNIQSHLLTPKGLIPTVRFDNITTRRRSRCSDSGAAMLKHSLSESIPRDSNNSNKLLQTSQSSPAATSISGVPMNLPLPKSNSEIKSLLVSPPGRNADLLGVGNIAQKHRASSTPPPPPDMPPRASSNPPSPPLTPPPSPPPSLPPRSHKEVSSGSYSDSSDSDDSQLDHSNSGDSQLEDSNFESDESEMPPVPPEPQYDISALEEDEDDAYASANESGIEEKEEEKKNEKRA